MNSNKPVHLSTGLLLFIFDYSTKDIINSINCLIYLYYTLQATYLLELNMQ